MERVKRSVLPVVWRLRQWVRALTRTWGVGLWISGLALLIVAGALKFTTYQRAQTAYWQTEQANLEQRTQRQEPISMAPIQDQSRLRLQAFENLLLPHDDIPEAVGDLLRLAEDEGLSIKRGEYRAQVEPKGMFLRYRINLPVEGKPESVNRFMTKALLKQKYLALNQVQFKREGLTAARMEARIQWEFLARLPAGAMAVAPRSAP